MALRTQPAALQDVIAGWLADHRVALTGCDTWSFGPYPPESPDVSFAVPQLLNVRYGVVVVENLRLADAAGDRVKGAS
jgi:hypothetical protein